MPRGGGGDSTHALANNIDYDNNPSNITWQNTIYTKYIHQDHMFNGTYPPNILSNLFNLEVYSNNREFFRYYNPRNYNIFRDYLPGETGINMDITKSNHYISRKHYGDIRIRFHLYSQQFKDQYIGQPAYNPTLLKTVLKLFYDFYSLDPNYTIIKYDPNITEAETKTHHNWTHNDAQIRLLVKHKPTGEIKVFQNFTGHVQRTNWNRILITNKRKPKDLNIYMHYPLFKMQYIKKVKPTITMEGKLNIPTHLLSTTKTEININTNFQKTGTKGQIIISGDSITDDQISRMTRVRSRYYIPKK